MSHPRRQSVRINPLASRSPAEIENDLLPFAAGLRKIDAHLLKHRSDMRLEPIDLPVPELIPARHDWNGQDSGAAMTLARRVRPSTFLEGFFLARLRKLPG